MTTFTFTAPVFKGRGYRVELRGDTAVISGATGEFLADSRPDNTRALEMMQAGREEILRFWSDAWIAQREAAGLPTRGFDPDSQYPDVDRWTTARSY